MLKWQNKTKKGLWNNSNKISITWNVKIHLGAVHSHPLCLSRAPLRLIRHICWTLKKALFTRPRPWHVKAWCLVFGSSYGPACNASDCPASQRNRPRRNTLLTLYNLSPSADTPSSFSFVLWMFSIIHFQTGDMSSQTAGAQPSLRFNTMISLFLEYSPTSRDCNAQLSSTYIKFDTTHNSYLVDI